MQLQLVTAGRANDTDRGAVLSLASGIVRELTSRVSELSMDLRPAALDTLGLLPSQLWHIERYQATTGVPVDFRHEGLARRFPAAVEITGYRVVQEGLTNVARHAQASTATIQLLADDRTMTVMIRDTGQGFELGRVAAQGVLSGMRERVELLGGTLSVESGTGTGTTVTADIPIVEPAQPGVAP